MKIIMKHGRKGFVLIFALLTASISSILLIPYISRVVSDYTSTSKIYNSTAALDLAEAGAERALWEINWNNHLFNGWTTTVNNGDNQARMISVNSFQTNTGQAIGDYDVSASTSDNWVSVTVTGTGYVPSRAVQNGKRIIRVAYAKHNFSKVFSATGSSAGAITLGTQDKIDSYDSSKGTYAQTHTNSNGNLATNGSIVIGNQAKVYGDANPGADFPFPSKPSGVSGSWGTLAAPVALDSAPLQDYVNNLKSSSITVNDNSNIQKGNSKDPNPLSGYAFNLGTQKTATLPGGTYHFTSLTLGTQAVLNVTGPSTIYVDSGNIVVGTQADLNIVAGKATKIVLDGGNMIVDTQGDVNNAGVPKNLTIYSTGSTISLTTQTDFYGAIYAPNAAVTLTTQGEIFGSVSSKTINCGTQAALHFDLDLLNVSPVFESSGVSAWQEIQQ